MAIATGAALVATTGISYAVWTASGTGSGAAQARPFNPPVVTVGTSSAQLYPGATGTAAGTLNVNITNDNPFNVSVVLAQDLTKLVTSDKPGCNETVNGASSVTGVSFSGGSFTVPANTTTAVPRSVPTSVAMSTASVSSCQGAVFTIPVTATATSS